MEYGIESFYIPEGKGRDYERGQLDVEVAVDRAGHGVIRSARRVASLP
jgi:uncharacterized membrane-anchored protein